MEEIKVRSMTVDDLRQVIEIENICHPTPWQISSFEYEIGNRDAILKVAVLGTTVIGFICVRTILDETHLMNIAVIRSFRSRGVGELLLNTVIDELRRSGSDAGLTLEVRESNLAALRLYEKAGFVESGRRTNYYRRPQEDAVIMKMHNEGFEDSRIQVKD